MRKACAKAQWLLCKRHNFLKIYLKSTRRCFYSYYLLLDHLLVAKLPNVAVSSIWMKPQKVLIFLRHIKSITKTRTKAIANTHTNGASRVIFVFLSEPDTISSLRTVWADLFSPKVVIIDSLAISPPDLAMKPLSGWKRKALSVQKYQVRERLSFLR